MSIECEPGFAEGGAFTRENPTSRSFFARSPLQLAGLFGKNRMPHATAGQCGAGFMDRPDNSVENDGPCLATTASSLCQATLRQLVLASHASPSSLARTSRAVG